MGLVKRNSLSGQGIVLVILVVGFAVTGARSLSEPAIPDITCSSAEECFEDAIRFAERNPDQFSLQYQRFHKIQEAYPGSVWGRRAGVRIGLALLGQDPADALQFFRAANQDFPLLKDYIRLWMGEAWVGSGAVRRAAEEFQSILELDSPSILKQEALLRAGLAWYEAGVCAEAISFLRQAVSLDMDSTRAARAWSGVADCADRLGQPDQAREALREIWRRYPETSEAETVNELVKNGRTNGLQWSPSPQDYYHRGLTFYRQARFEKTISDLRMFLASRPKSPQFERAQFKLGMAYVRLKRYGQAERVFQLLAEGRSSYAGKASAWLARVYLRQDKGEALLALKDNVSSLLSRDQRARIFWMCGIWLEDQGKPNQAISSYRKAVQTAGPSHARVDALWRIGWLHYQGRAYKVAADAFQRMADRAIDRRETEQARYWKARALEHTGQAHQAQNLYGRLAKDFPMTYYGQLAQSRLRDIPEALDLDEDPLGFSPRTQANLFQLQKELPYRKAQELQALGLSQEAAGELLWLVSHYTSNPDALLELSVQLAKSGAYDAALGLAKRYFQNSLERGHLVGRSGLWPVAYPTVYLPNILTYADGSLDPYLVAGIIREESLYNPRALSPVGAIGLMQLMPDTATRVARQLGLPPLDREDLFEGDTNIRLGTRYVSQLLGQFRGNLVQAVAAYNAGPEAVSRWISKFGQRDPDEFVELISFQETRRYVKRVITSYRIYLHLLSTRCSAFSLDTIC